MYRRAGTMAGSLGMGIVGDGDRWGWGSLGFKGGGGGGEDLRREDVFLGIGSWVGIELIERF